MGKGKGKGKNNQFIDSALVNDLTYYDYLDRLKKITLSMFEWVNLPKSMDSRFLEKSLYYSGQAAILFDELVGYVNTNCVGDGKVNMYGLPTSLRCFSNEYEKTRELYTGLSEPNSEDTREAILVMNDWERKSTAGTIELFAYRLYEAERTCDVNIKRTKISPYYWY